MWLSGGAKPDFRTINYFRGKRLKGIFDDLFRQVVELLHKEGFVSLEVQYIDGTKIESAANKYSFVWRGSVEKHDKRLREKTDAVLREIEQVIHDEQQEADTESTLPTEEFISRVERIKERMDSENLSKSHCKAIRKVEGESIPKMKEYERHLTTMGERNSYSKSDPDATFMRMKEDAMLNGQLKPGYNYRSPPRINPSPITAFSKGLRIRERLSTFWNLSIRNTDCTAVELSQMPDTGVSRTTNICSKRE